MEADPPLEDGDALALARGGEGVERAFSDVGTRVEAGTHQAFGADDRVRGDVGPHAVDYPIGVLVEGIDGGEREREREGEGEGESSTQQRHSRQQPVPSICGTWLHWFCRYSRSGRIASRHW